eukprot:XP_005625149.1 synapsin-1-like [Canis lupus familiaris]
MATAWFPGLREGPARGRAAPAASAAPPPAHRRRSQPSQPRSRPGPRSAARRSPATRGRPRGRTPTCRPLEKGQKSTSGIGEICGAQLRKHLGCFPLETLVQQCPRVPVVSLATMAVVLEGDGLPPAGCSGQQQRPQHSSPAPLPPASRPAGTSPLMVSHGGELLCDAISASCGSPRFKQPSPSSLDTGFQEVPLGRFPAILQAPR